jgi:hypothetical protein
MEIVILLADGLAGKPLHWQSNIRKPRISKTLDMPQLLALLVLVGL